MAMEMDHSFTVPVPPDQAWGILLDVERIAPCMPGATVDDVDGDVVNGRIKVKVGPVSLTYKGTAKFTERDADARVVVLEAAGKETRGTSTASATVRASMVPDGSGTEVTMHTSMNVTGRPAQFGRGVMVEVGGKLIQQFATNLAALISGDGGSPAAGSGNAGSGAAGTATTESASGDGAGAPATTADTSAGNGSASPAAGPATSPAATSSAATSSATASTATASTGATSPAAANTVRTNTAAPAQEDSLNLVKLVGPVLLKRLVPVVAGAAGVAFLGRLFWRLRHRSGRAAKA